GTRFQDTFTSGCACSLVFYARIVATSHAAACARRQQRAVPPAPTHVLPKRTEAALLPTGPPAAAMTVTAAVASSDTVVTAATNLQSAVPAAPKPHEHQHAPPVLEPSPVQRSACAAGKRRRLNSSATTAPCMPLARVQDADAQAAQHSGTEAVQQHAVEGSVQLLETQGAAVADQPSPPQRSAPARQPRLRLRQLNEEELDAAAEALQALADAMASKISDADSWTTGEGYISAIPERIREALQPYATQPPQPGRPRQQRQRRPPRVTRTQREHRLDEALDDMEATQQETPRDQRAVRRARRRVGRVRASMAQQELRQAFAKDEAKCVAKILASASAEAAAEEHPEACPIDAATLHAHFTGTNAPRTDFDYDAASGQEFRAALDSLQPATIATDAFEEELTLDEVEDQLT
ncbi:hypothetical protein PC121_g24098, partial [Phytophthora cactorum]